MNVESMPLHSSKSTTMHVAPAPSSFSHQSLTNGLLINDPFPSQRIHENSLLWYAEIEYSSLTIQRWRHCLNDVETYTRYSGGSTRRAAITTYKRSSFSSHYHTLRGKRVPPCPPAIISLRADGSCPLAMTVSTPASSANFTASSFEAIPPMENFP